ncbi:hypothetical protein HK098_007586 [Nowakowskiella sp. JEL0407]|nr:hypothetical protein HK098_007586 [Nowakowskiella sp. JEL0407]
MSFSWDAVDERERKKHEKELALRDYLLKQQEELRSRYETSTRQDQKNVGYQGNNGGKLTGNESLTRNMNSLFGGQVFSDKPSINPIPKNPATLNSDVRLNHQTNSPPPKQYENEVSSPKPTSFTQNVNWGPANEELYAKLRYTEEQLVHEQRTRGWLESEVQHSKNAVAQLSVKVEQLMAAHAQDQILLRDIKKELDSTERKSSEITTELGNRLDRDNIKLHSQVSDLSARQRNLEKIREEADERSRSFAETLNNTQYKVESISLMASELSAEFRSRVRDIEFEQQRGSDTMRQLQEHDHILGVIQQKIEASVEMLNKKIEGVVGEQRIKFDQDARARQNFEQNMRDLYQDVRKSMQSQDRELGDRLEAAKQSMIQLADRERMERDKAIAGVMDQCRSVERAVKEVEQRFAEKLTSNMTVIESTLNEDRANRVKFETQIRSDCDEGFKILNQMMAKKWDEIQIQKNELKQALNISTKTFQESLILIEKTSEARYASLEDVLKAEVKARMNTDAKLQEVEENLDQKREALHRILVEQIQGVAIESQVADEKLEQEIKNTYEQLNEAKTRSIDDVETQLSQIRMRSKEFEVTLNHKLKDLHTSIELSQKVTNEALTEVEGKILTKLSDARADIEITMDKVRRVELLSAECKIEVDEKLNTRQVQFDRALEALKDEISKRITQQEALDREAHMKATIHSMQTNVGYLQSSITNLKEEIGNRVTKKELSIAETQLQTITNTLHSKTVSIDDAINQVREEVALRATKKETTELDSRFKSSVLKLQTRDIELEDMVGAIKEEMSEFVQRQYLSQIENKIMDKIHSVEDSQVALQINLADLTEKLGEKSTKNDLEGLSATVSAFSDALENQLRDTRELIELTKEEISKATQEDLNEMASGIKAAVDTLEAKTNQFEEIVEGLKLKVTDSDAVLRAKIRDVVNIQDLKFSEQTNAISSVRNTCHEEVSLIKSRLDDFPRALNQAETNYTEFKRWVTEHLNDASNKTMGWISEIRESTQNKVSEDQLERIETDVLVKLSKLQGKVDLTVENFSQLKARMAEIEQNIKNSHQGLMKIHEENLQENFTTAKQWKENFQAKIEEINFQLQKLPKALEQNKNDIKKIKFDIDTQLTVDFNKLEKEFRQLQGELYTKPSEKTILEILNNGISPIFNRIDRFNSIIDEIWLELRTINGKRWQYDEGTIFNDNTIQNQAGRSLQDNINSSSNDRSGPRMAQMNFYKPAHLIFPSTDTASSNTQKDISSNIMRNKIKSDSSKPNLNVPTPPLPTSPNQNQSNTLASNNHNSISQTEVQKLDNNLEGPTESDLLDKLQKSNSTRNAESDVLAKQQMLLSSAVPSQTSLFARNIDAEKSSRSSIVQRNTNQVTENDMDVMKQTKNESEADMYGPAKFFEELADQSLLN